MTSEQPYPCCDKMNGPAWIDGRYCRPVCEVHGYQTEPEARQHQTSKLRPAVEVWTEAEMAACHGAEYAAAAVIEADREAVRAYWYRQGKDDGWQMCRENEIDRLREELAEAYVKLSGKSIHTSDCATSYAPAMEPGPCNCDAPGDADLVSKLRDEDSHYRIQEKHWCIDAEELERQRLAAAALIETQAREIERLREALSKADEAHWFYYGDDCSSEQCRFSIHECIDEDFEWDNRPVGDHVLQISGARPVPDMWVSLHYFTEEEKDARQDDEPYAYTVHATEEEARAALAGDSHDQ